MRFAEARFAVTPVAVSTALGAVEWGERPVEFGVERMFGFVAQIQPRENTNVPCPPVRTRVRTMVRPRCLLDKPWQSFYREESGRGTQVVRERSAKPLHVGSIPTRASKPFLRWRWQNTPDCFGRRRGPRLLRTGFIGVILALEMKDIQDYVRTAVYQHYVAPDENVGASRGRRGQTLLEFLGNRRHLFSESGRQGSAHAQLPFESRRQLFPLCQAGR